MKYKKSFILVLAFTITLLLGGTAIAGESHFVDLDGDGISDNAVDLRDGFFLDESESDAESAGMGATTVDFFSSVSAEVVIELPLTVREKFTERRFNARAQCKSRCDLESDFGGSGGIGVRRGRSDLARVDGLIPHVSDSGQGIVRWLVVRR